MNTPQFVIDKLSIDVSTTQTCQDTVKGAVAIPVLIQSVMVLQFANSDRRSRHGDPVRSIHRIALNAVQKSIGVVQLTSAEEINP